VYAPSGVVCVVEPPPGGAPPGAPLGCPLGGTPLLGELLPDGAAALDAIADALLLAVPDTVAEPQPATPSVAAVASTAIDARTFMSCSSVGDGTSL